MECKCKLLESSDGESLENRTFEPEIALKKKQKLNMHSCYICGPNNTEKKCIGEYM